jgi:hypothetical protein
MTSFAISSGQNKCDERITINDCNAMKEKIANVRIRTFPTKVVFEQNQK